MTPPFSGPLFRVGVLVSAGPGFDGLPAAHVLHADGCHDRLQPIRVHLVVVELRPAALAARHEVPAIEVERERARPRCPRDVIEVRHDPEHAQAAVLLDERHRVGVRGQQAPVRPAACRSSCPADRR